MTPPNEVPMAEEHAERTPLNSNKRTRPYSKRNKSTAEKRKRISSQAITSITPVNLDSSSEEEEETFEMASGGKEDEAEFSVKKQTNNTIAVSDLERLLDKRFAVLATAEQINEMGQRISKNESEIAEIRTNIEQINQRMKTNLKPPTESPTHDRKMAPRMGPGRELSYHISRRSLRIWPIEGNTHEEMDKALKEFIKSALRIPDFESRSLRAERIRRTRTSPKSASYLEVCVTFTNQDDRDFVASKAVNLAELVENDGKPRAGVRMDVPGHLMPTNNDLKSYAYQTRQSHGKGTKTHIKYDDQKMDLYLEVKLPGSDNWLRIMPEQARELITSNTSREVQELQSNLRRRARDGSTTGSSISSSLSTSSLLSGGNSQPLINQHGWQPPRRDNYARMEFGGQ